MRKKLLAVLLSVSLVFTLAACGNEDVSNEVANSESSVESSGDSEAGTDTVTERDEADVSTEESNKVSSEDVEIESIESVEPEVIVHEHAYVEELVSEPTCTSVGLKKFTCECGEFYEEGIDMVAHDLGDYVYNNDATYEKDGTESASCKVCNNIIETRTKEGTMLVKEPEVAPIPNGLDTTIGSELALNGTITSHNGATLNKLASFNKAGLYNAPSEYSSNFEWCGYFNNDDPNLANTPQGKATGAWRDNMARIEKSLYGENYDPTQVQGFDIWNDTVYFNYVSGGSSGAIELLRNPGKGCYELRINYDISAGVGIYDANDGRDVLLAMCTMISSTPKELEEKLYYDAFVEAIFSQDSYTKVGDCKVKLIYFLPENNSIAYAIKP